MVPPLQRLRGPRPAAPAVSWARSQACCVGSSGLERLLVSAAREPLACRACSVSPGSARPPRFCRGRRQLSCRFCVYSGVGSPGDGEPSSSGRDDHFISPANRRFWGVCAHACTSTEFSPLPVTLEHELHSVNQPMSLLCFCMLLTPVLEKWTWHTT